MGKTKYLSAFERGMVVGAKRNGLSVSRTAALLGFSYSTVSRSSRSSSQWQASGQKQVIDEMDNGG